MGSGSAKVEEANAASVALIEGKRVLLIQRAEEPFRGRWTLPGGRREPGESIPATAVREVHEELGLAVSGLLPVMMLQASSRFRLQVFATTTFSGEIAPSSEITAWQWVALGQFADLPITPNLSTVLERAFARFAQP